MKYSVIIPTCNRSDDLSCAINSILQQTVLPYEVIIVDQSDDLRTKEYIDSLITRENKIQFHYFHLKEKSAVRARNKGIYQAKCDIVSFIDDDVVLEKDYAEKILITFEKRKDLGGLSGSDLHAKEQSSLKWKTRKFLMKIFLISNFKGKATLSGFGYPIYEKPIKQFLEVDMLPGCNMNFRNKLLDKFHFDEWFTGYSFREDVDFSFNLSKVTSLAMIPEAKLFHNYSTSNRMDIESQKIMEVTNHYFFYKKHFKKGLIKTILFTYSLSGILFISFIELLHKHNKTKYRQLKGLLKGIILLIKQHKNFEAHRDG